ncbi:hypothetical protein MUN81_08930 [Hymenobacter sp. 5317J-9]|uniref:hypothetical protein n=1 Tax=Hymenobacter sp. 5317J-9 TaxID=2932250 RepID=UPI001FD6AC15|nr:hypothetical protein [Hymenobacter sp. 5317J-9]UOQ99601.1 hypothetical protein MUN81_08930 [Hymenobacter sp. 5317J-9]
MSTNKTRYPIAIKLRYSLMRFSVLLLILWGSLPTSTWAQDAPSYNMRFVTANVIDTVDGKDVIVFFHVSAAKAKDFPPVVSMRVMYSVDGSEVTKASIGRTDNVSIIAFDRGIEGKSKLGYSLVKDKVDLNDKADFMLLAIFFKDLTRKPISDMAITYGLWEKRNTEVRVEKEYKFHVENYVP